MLIELVFKFRRGLTAQGAVEPLWVVKARSVNRDTFSGGFENRTIIRQPRPSAVRKEMICVHARKS